MKAETGCSPLWQRFNSKSRSRVFSIQVLKEKKSYYLAKLKTRGVEALKGEVPASAVEKLAFLEAIGEYKGYDAISFESRWQKMPKGERKEFRQVLRDLDFKKGIRYSRLESVLVDVYLQSHLDHFSLRYLFRNGISEAFHEHIVRRIEAEISVKSLAGSLKELGFVRDPNWIDRVVGKMDKYQNWIDLIVSITSNAYSLMNYYTPIYLPQRDFISDKVDHRIIQIAKNRGVNEAVNVLKREYPTQTKLGAGYAFGLNMHLKFMLIFTVFLGIYEGMSAFEDMELDEEVGDEKTNRLFDNLNNMSSHLQGLVGIQPGSDSNELAKISQSLSDQKKDKLRKEINHLLTELQERQQANDELIAKFRAAVAANEDITVDLPWTTFIAMGSVIRSFFSTVGRRMFLSFYRSTKRVKRKGLLLSSFIGGIGIIFIANDMKIKITVPKDKIPGLLKELEKKKQGFEASRDYLEKLNL